jgi:tRNA(Ile)-lysidine synthase
MFINILALAAASSFTLGTMRSFQLTVLRQFPLDQTYLVGVSGGRDSITLLHYLVDLGYRKLIVCHLDHRLRGQQSRADVRFVKKLAQEYDLEIEAGATDVHALAAKEKISIETAARNARYRFFAEVARRRRCRTIFLGHHADDLVETFLINLFRGTGTAGLAGMREVAVHRVGKLDLTVVRPFLSIWRDAIDEYVDAHHLKFREDATNKSLVPLRNRVRQKIIPLLEKHFGRRIRKSIWRAASLASEEEAFFEELLPGKLSTRTQLAIEPLRAMPVAVQRRMLHGWLRAGEVSGVSFDLVERVRALLDLANGVAKTNLPGQRHVRRRAGQLFME